VLYWQNRELLFENFALQSKISSDPLACSMLHCCHQWRSARDVAAELGNYEEASVRKTLAELCKCGLLERSDRKRDARVQSLERWAHWNPVAGFFHFSTKDTPYASDQRGVLEQLKRRAQRDPMPLAVKMYRNATRTKLPAVAPDGEFAVVLKARRTWRKFGKAPVALDALAQMLHLTFGIQQWVNVPGLGRAAIKTSPSGGSLHPIEAYVLARRVSDLRAGLYHYNAEQHELEWLRQSVSRQQLEKNLASQWWFSDAAFFVVMTAIFGRTQWKYDFPRAYRLVLAESGHLCQTFCLTATWLGLAPFCTMALTDTQWEKWLGIDGVSESILYIAGAGTRPEAARMRDATLLTIGKPA
jgi:SagB-type dehydrogenase family enzyme